MEITFLPFEWPTINAKMTYAIMAHDWYQNDMSYKNDNMLMYYSVLR